MKVIARTAMRPLVSRSAGRRPLATGSTSTPTPTSTPLPPSDIPQHAPPAAWQRGAQALGFVMAGIAGAYGVLFYDFEKQDHCFVPVRRQFEGLRDQFMTLPPELQKSGEARRAELNSLTKTSDGSKKLV